MPKLADFAPELLAGVIALSLVLFVQPWVEAHKRRRERWEAAVTSLAAFLREQFTRSLNGYRHLVDSEAFFMDRRGDPAANKDRLERLINQTRVEMEDAHKALSEELERLQILASNCRSIHPRAPQWTMLRRDIAMLSLCIAISRRFAVPSENAGEEDMRRYVKDAEAVLVRITNAVYPMAETLKPPPRKLISRLRMKATPTWTKARARIVDWRNSTPGDESITGDNPYAA